jgi:alpha-D-ribose 1-methylphosphonate 5-triphosphate diphosphatase
MTTIRNGKIITPDATLEGFSLIIDGDRIRAVAPDGISGTGDIVDAGGAYVMPGFIDIHADYIERMAAPRPTSVMDFTLALREAERELVGHGITTMFHSLSMYKQGDFGTSPMRSAENTRSLMELVHDSHRRQHLIRHRIHARFEIDNVERVAELEAYIREKKIHLLSFMDHTPGQGQFRSIESYRRMLKGYRNLSETELDDIVESWKDREKLTSDAISGLAALAKAHGLAVASHDDDTIEKLELVRSYGVRISEFPITLEVARAARAAGMHTVAGAPNILLGGSHSGNLSAAEAILDGAVDVLCSDYYPASLLHAVFRMHREHDLPLHGMVRLVTTNAAKAVGLSSETGSLEAGLKADFLIVDLLDDGFPVVASAYVDGREVLGTTYRR